MDGWQVGEKVRFNAKQFNWQDWVGTLKTCELPQVAVYDYVVRIHYLEANQMGAVIAYGVIVAQVGYQDKKQAGLSAMIRSQRNGIMPKKREHEDKSSIQDYENGKLISYERVAAILGKSDFKKLHLGEWVQFEHAEICSCLDCKETSKNRE